MLYKICLHGRENYYNDDGSEKFIVCELCLNARGETSIEKVERTHKKITDYGSLYVNGSDVDHVSFVEFTVPDHASAEFFNNACDCGVNLEYGENLVNGLKVVVYRSKAKNFFDKHWFSSNVYFSPNENFEVPPELKVHCKGKRMYVSSNDFAAFVMSETLKG